MRKNLLRTAALVFALGAVVALPAVAGATEPHLGSTVTCVSPTEADVTLTVTSGGAAGTVTGVWGWPAAVVTVGAPVTAEWSVTVTGRATVGVQHRNGLQIDYGTDKGNRATHLDVLVPSGTCDVPEATTTTAAEVTTTTTDVATTTTAAEVTTSTTTVYVPGDGTTTVLPTSVTTAAGTATRLPATGAGSVWLMLGLAGLLVALGLAARRWAGAV